MKRFLKVVRWVLARIILFLDVLFTPRPKITRSEEESRRVGRETAQLALYQFNGCPFCVKVRRELKRLNIQIELRNADTNAQWKAELMKEGGHYQVPCLKIPNPSSSAYAREYRWLYESDAIIAYLNEQFGAAG